jgi:hypothetical protein
VPPLPPPLPPESRTVGQLVAETIRLYGRRFWIALPLGLGVAVLDQLAGISRDAWLVLMLTGGAAVLSASYVAGAAIATETRLTARTALTAFAAGVIAFAPVPFLLLVFILPAVAWLAFVGLAVPVAVVERAGVAAALRRATRLARADYIHALGSLATLAIVYFLTRFMLTLLLHGQGEQTERIAILLADLVLAPMLFLGPALLYYDQAARLEARTRERRG